MDYWAHAGKFNKTELPGQTGAGQWECSHAVNTMMSVAQRVA